MNFRRQRLGAGRPSGLGGNPGTRRRSRPAWVCCLLLLTLAGCDQEELIQVDTEKQANEVLVELADQKVHEAQKEPITNQQRKTAWKITVPSAELSRARSVLVRADLPHEAQSGFEAMIGQAGLIPTKTDERAKLMFAMAGELSRTLEQVEGVLQARVHVVIPEKDLLRPPTDKGGPQPSALVLIKYAPRDQSGMEAGAQATGASDGAPSGRRGQGQASAEGAPLTVEEVQKMVAKGVEGLLAENVSVSFTKAKPRVLPTPDPAPAWRRPVNQLALGCAALAVLAGVAVFLYWRERRKNWQGRPAAGVAGGAAPGGALPAGAALAGRPRAAGAAE